MPRGESCGHVVLNLRAAAGYRAGGPSGTRERT